MGCDIHCVVEKKEDGKWVSVWKDHRDEYGTIENYYFPRFRSYKVFSILADVRNNGDIQPISQPKGMPEDPSLEYTQLVSEWSDDGHGHSFLTLRELLEYNWEQDNRFYKIVIPRLKEIDQNIDNVRICFFFDN